MDFPVFTFLDVARMQYELIKGMGISRLHAVIPPSAGNDCTTMGGSLSTYGRADDWRYYEPTKIQLLRL